MGFFIRTIGARRYRKRFPLNTTTAEVETAPAGKKRGSIPQARHSKAGPRPEEPMGTRSSNPSDRAAGAEFCCSLPPKLHSRRAHINSGPHAVSASIFVPSTWMTLSQRRGAPNVDSACTGTTMGDYPARGQTLAHLPEKYFELYETQAAVSRKPEEFERPRRRHSTVEVTPYSSFDPGQLMTPKEPTRMQIFAERSSSTPSLIWECRRWCERLSSPGTTLNQMEEFYIRCTLMFAVIVFWYSWKHTSTPETHLQRLRIFFLIFRTRGWAHAKKYTDRMAEAVLESAKKSFVVELASNDGYLLQYFAEKACAGAGGLNRRQMLRL